MSHQDGQVETFAWKCAPHWHIMLLHLGATLHPAKSAHFAAALTR